MIPHPGACRPAVPNPLYSDAGAAPAAPPPPPSPPRAQALTAQWFAELDGDGDGFLTGDEARAFFLQSAVPVPALARVWASFPKRRRGHLDAAEFAHMYAAVHALRDDAAPGGAPPAEDAPEHVQDCAT